MLQSHAVTYQSYQSSPAVPKSTKPDKKGVIMPPQLHIEPSQYVVPLLHLLIDLVNKAWSSMLLFFDEFIEDVSPREAKIKEDIKEIQHILSYYECKTEILTVNKNMAYEELVHSPAERESIMCTVTETTANLRNIAENKKGS